MVHNVTWYLGNEKIGNLILALYLEKKNDMRCLKWKTVINVYSAIMGDMNEL